MPIESRRSSYVRVAREVVPTSHLENFRSRIEDLALEVLPSQGTTTRRIARSKEELKQEGMEPQFRTIERSPVNVYEANGMRVTFLERRLPRSQRANRSLFRFLGRLAEIDLTMLTDSPSPALLPVESSSIVESSHRLQNPNYREFSLLLDDSSAVRRMQSEYEVLQKYGGPSDTFTSPQLIPLFTVPGRTDRHSVDEYVERINLDGFAHPLVSVQLNIPELDSKIR
jgi:hypothetical protein